MSINIEHFRTRQKIGQSFSAKPRERIDLSGTSLAPCETNVKTVCKASFSPHLILQQVLWLPMTHDALWLLPARWHSIWEYVHVYHLVRGRFTPMPIEGPDFFLSSVGILRIIVRNSSKSILPLRFYAETSCRPQQRLRPSPFRSTSFMMASTSCFVYLVLHHIHL